MYKMISQCPSKVQPRQGVLPLVAPRPPFNPHCMEFRMPACQVSKESFILSQKDFPTSSLPSMDFTQVTGPIPVPFKGRPKSDAGLIAELRTAGHVLRSGHSSHTTALCHGTNKRQSGIEGSGDRHSLAPCSEHLRCARLPQVPR